MAVLGDNTDRSESRRGAQDRSDIVRVGDLVEDEQHSLFASAAQKPIEPCVLERLDLDDHALVWRVMRNQPAEVGNVRQRDRYVLGKLHEGRCLAGCPGLQYLAIGIVERGGDSVLSPQSWSVRRSVTMVRFLPPRHRIALSFPGAAVQLRRCRLADAQPPLTT